MFCVHDSIAIKISQKPLCHLIHKVEGYTLVRP